LACAHQAQIESPQDSALVIAALVHDCGLMMGFGKGTMPKFGADFIQNDLCLPPRVSSLIIG
jgi:hypothetical protein